MAEPLRHRQTKGAETDMPGLPPPRHIPTLPDYSPRSVRASAARPAKLTVPVACREYLGDLDRGIEGYLWPADDHRRDQDVKKSAASRNPSVKSVRELWVIAGREVGYGLNSQPDRCPHRGLQ
jgi:hypothetical protein